MSNVDIAEDDASANLAMISNEEYKIWKKNSPFLYDMVITHALEWPTLTIQWFPDKEVFADKGFARHRLLMGTHTSGQDQNYLQIATANLPLTEGESDTKLEVKDYDEEKGATRAVNGLTYVFDRTKHSNQPDADGKCRPDITLQGQTKEGYGLAWNPVKQGHILAASEDTTVCHWDINAYQKDRTVLDPLQVYRGHSSIVEDVAWHNFHEHLFASVGDDRQMLLWDTRESSDSPKHRIEAHSAEVNAVSFSLASEYILATGSSDKTVALWDLRNLSVCLHSLEAHTDEVLQIAWSPHHETLLASASADRRVNIWDLSRIGEEQTAEDAEDGPAELLFVHGGHTSRPTDMAWSPQDPCKVATSAEDNIVMVWQPANSIIEPADIEPDVAELE
ncbi:Histone acetyltransferase type B subunit 2 [Malassezia yamatoensis]|uniref:Histone acetyltransferase type B subunit 2 n=1 Tax=Malassezia yamatoensis TaxID=253288 RepID=A0AAJ5YSH6_9BASI|nr:Histone acetyltransferase type B subunit 2 [Malassezia yamatoensis]